MNWSKSELRWRRRPLMLDVAPELFPNIQGSTDSEVLFHLAPTYELEEDPVVAMERTIGLVEATAVRHGIEGCRAGDRVVVSEPMSELPGLWHEIPESTVLLVQPGPDEQRPFRPHFDAAAGSGQPGARPVSEEPVLP